jgi:hypothetical protein
MTTRHEDGTVMSSVPVDAADATELPGFLRDCLDYDRASLARPWPASPAA